MRRQWFIFLGLVGITFWLYWPTGGFEQVYFDDTFFTEHPEVRSGVTGHSLWWALTNAEMANWHPVTSLSFVVMHQLFGQNAGAEHLLNTLIHALTAGLLFLALGGLIRAGATDAETEVPVGRCALVAALFAWHPLRVESVAWIAERKDVLCGMFLMLTLWAYAKYAEALRREPGPERRKRAASFLAASLGFFALGLMSKAMLVTVPGLLILLDIWPLRRISWAALRAGGWKRLGGEKIPFLALTILFCVVTLLAQQAGNATPTLKELPLGLRLENVIVSYLRYLGWSLWPTHLAVYYAFPYDSHFYLALWPVWQIVAGGLVLGLFSYFCLRQLSQRPYLAVGWFWYLGTLVPVIGLVQVGGQGMADRYTYIPLIGPVLALVWGLAELGRHQPWCRRALAGAGVVGLVAALLQTRYQLQFWKNTDALFQHTIEVTGENPRAEYVLGLGLEHEGRLEAAMAHYRNAISSQPRVKEAYAAMARIFDQQGQWTEAEQVYRTLLTDNPKDFAGHLGLVNVLVQLGRVAEAKEQREQAESTLPPTPEAENNLAWTLATSPAPEIRDGAKAVQLAERACETTHYRETIMVGTLAAAYAEAGQFDRAVATAQQAIELAEANGQPDLKRINEQLRETYRSGQPYHESVRP